MQRVRRRDTGPELRLRSELHRRGLRFRVDVPIDVLPRHRADLVFGPAKVAVYVDGCFWHGCPVHGAPPKSNSQWWTDKIAGVRQRDVVTNRALIGAGWAVLRVWEHEDPLHAADAIQRAVESRRNGRRGRVRAEDASPSAGLA